jgi:hypothetical protein
MKTFIYVLITNFVFAETDEKVIKANVCVNVALPPPPPAGGCSRLKTYRQGAHEALCKKQVQGRESVSHDGDSISPSRIDVECKRVADVWLILIPSDNHHDSFVTYYVYPCGSPSFSWFSVVAQVKRPPETKMYDYCWAGPIHPKLAKRLRRILRTYIRQVEKYIAKRQQKAWTTWSDGTRNTTKYCTYR